MRFSRNGPGQLEVFGARIDQPFDGDGMVCRFSFADGKANFSNRCPSQACCRAGRSGAAVSSDLLVSCTQRRRILVQNGRKTSMAEQNLDTCAVLVHRYVRTREFQEEQEAGKILYAGAFASGNPSGQLLNNPFTFQVKNVANTGQHAKALDWGGSGPCHSGCRSLVCMGPTTW